MRHVVDPQRTGSCDSRAMRSTDPEAERAAVLAAARRNAEAARLDYTPADARRIREKAGIGLAPAARAIPVGSATHLSRLERGLIKPTHAVRSRWFAFVAELERAMAESAA